MNHEDTETQRAELNALSHRVIGLCLEVHRILGPGLLESAYEEALAYEMSEAGIDFIRQQEVPLWYKGISLKCGYRVDFAVEAGLVLELKAVSDLLPIHHAQVLTYLKLRDCPLGLLINFNVVLLKDGIRRIAHGPLFQH